MSERAGWSSRSGGVNHTGGHPRIGAEAGIGTKRSVWSTRNHPAKTERQFSDGRWSCYFAVPNKLSRTASAAAVVLFGQCSLARMLAT
ncbi:hypothetical protein SAMN04487820_11242 [Actinopolyspora mzabensis]|uniref:Uncharacterized protein n=1 Tax=Actinopolyspora mzabensis TaxID=995066 RepID=A0A1G9EGX5_ACTMZ|nr:hypothetical protein SAMN04487820_11242 [Actinopolyspora mzabensis]